jgi:glutamyl-tRNA reductase
VDRTSRYLMARTLQTCAAEPVARRLRETIGRLPACKRHSLTLDNGREFARPPELERRLGLILCGPRPELYREHEDAFYARAGTAAARHLFRVATGLDSMVQGEAQILGQVHRAHELAREGGVGPILDRLSPPRVSAGKRARNETGGRAPWPRPRSSWPARWRLARKRTALVIRRETGRLVAQHLSAQRLHSSHRQPHAGRAQDLAEVGDARSGGRGRNTGVSGPGRSRDLSPQPIITRAMVQKRAAPPALHRSRHLDSAQRRGRASLEGAFVYDMDALQKVVRGNMARQEDEILRSSDPVRGSASSSAGWARSRPARSSRSSAST